MTTAGVPVAPPGVTPDRGGTSRTGAKRGGNHQPRAPPPLLNRSNASLRTCSVRVRIALLAACQEIPRAAATRETDMHSRARAPLDRRVGQPGPGLSQGGGVLSPHPAAVGAGEAPQAHHQLRGPPPHRHVGQAPGHRPASLPLRPAGSAEGVLEPDRHAALDHRALDCEVLAHHYQSQGIQARGSAKSGQVLGWVMSLMARFGCRDRGLVVEAIAAWAP